MSVHVAWMSEAACVGQPDLFFTEKVGNGSRIAAERAKTICAACPVKDDCDTYAEGEHYGVWGGQLRSSRKLKGLKPIQHGTNSGYKQHNRRGIPPCLSCTEAHRAYVNEWAAKKRTA